MSVSPAAELMESLVDDGTAGRGERLQQGAGAQRQPHWHGNRVPVPIVHATHALEGDWPSGPAKPHFHRALVKIMRPFHQFLCASYDPLGTTIDQQDRITARNVDVHQISTDLARPLV